jgi:hypothetical protein
MSRAFASVWSLVNSCHAGSNYDGRAHRTSVRAALSSVRIRPLVGGSACVTDADA